MSIDNATSQTCNQGFEWDGSTCVECGAGRYQDQPASRAQCYDWSVCAAGKKQNVVPTLKVNRGCTACDPGRYQASNSFTGTTCALWSLCAAGKKQNVAPTLKVNRGCTNCDAGKFQTSDIFTGTSCVRSACLLFLFHSKIL